MSKRFDLQISPGPKPEQYCIIDTEQEVLTIYNDLGCIHFTSAPAVCDLLNEQDNMIKSLENEHSRLTNQLRLAYDKINELTGKLEELKK